MNYINEIIVKFTDWINYISGGNEFLAGTMVLAFTGYLYLLKSVPSKMFRYVYRRLTKEIRVDNINPIAYSGGSGATSGVESIIRWHQKHWFYRFVRTTEYLPMMDMNVPLGTYYTFYKGSLYKLNYNAKVIETISSTAPPKIVEVIITKFGIRTTTKSILDMIKKELELVKKDKNPPVTHIAHESGFEYSGKRNLINSPVIETKENLEFMSKVESFLNRKDWYKEKYLPYKESFLLYGESGVGKSSIIRQVSDKFELDIIQVNMSDLKTKTSRTINSIIKSLEHLHKEYRPTILLFEDIDTLGRGVSQRNIDDSNDSDFVLSELLNLLDGVNGVENVIVVMTTNYISKLDEALLRKGRANHKIKFEKYTKRDIINFIGVHFKDEEFDESKLNGMELKVADVGNAYISCPHNVEEFVDYLVDVHNKI